MLKRTYPRILMIFAGCFFLMCSYPYVKHFTMPMREESSALRTHDDTTITNTDLHPGHQTWMTISNADQHPGHQPSTSDSEKQHQGPTCREKNHIVFIKLYKVAGSTTGAILFRFGLRRNLTFGIPVKSSCLNCGNIFDWSNMVPGPPGRTNIDIICNHATYEKMFLQSHMPNDTVYISIIREPLTQLASSVYFIVSPKSLEANRTSKYLMTFVSNSRKNVLPSPQSRGLGLPIAHVQDTRKIQDFIAQVDTEFTLIMITEYIHESLLLLRRELCWGWKDLIYVSQKVLTNRPEIPTNPDLVAKHKAISKADYMLYDHFKSQLLSRIEKAGAEFQSDLEKYRSLLSKVWEFCDDIDGKEELNTHNLTFSYFEYGEDFQLTGLDCLLLQSDMQNYVEYLKRNNTLDAHSSRIYFGKHSLLHKAPPRPMNPFDLQKILASKGGRGRPSAKSRVYFRHNPLTQKVGKE